MSHVMRKPIYAIFDQQSASAQSDQRLRCSLPRQYNIASSYIFNFMSLASNCSRAGGFESYLVANPEDRFSHEEAQITIREAAQHLES